MKIGFNTASIYNKDGTPRELDGIGNYTLGLMTHLAKKNNVEVVPCYFDLTLKDILQLNKSGSQLLAQPNIFLQDILPLNWFKQLENKIDLLHSTDYRTPKLKKTPIVATLHDAIMLKKEKYANQTLRGFKNALLKKHAQYADHIITISNSIVSDIINYWNIDPKKISVIYNAIADSWLTPLDNAQKEQVLKRYKIKQKFLLFVGTLQPRKNLDRTLTAYQSLPQDIQNTHQLIIVGKKGWDCEQTIKNIFSLQARGLVRWLEFVAENNLRALYQSATAVVFPSLSEGFGLPIIEGFASQTPVITSNILPMSEIAGNAAYLVDPLSPDEIRKALEKIITNNNLRYELIQKGKFRIKDFTYPQTIEKVIALYDKLLR